ncbi:MAG: tetratricopeptide repeat protein, partial [Isosphaeraceae bacterium]
LRATNRLAEAEPLYRRALAIDERSYGPDHPTVALNNLAVLLQATNRLAEAEPLYRRALAIDERSYGPDHPTVALRLNNLASLLRATNRLDEAEPLSRRAVQILIQFGRGTGHEHPNLRAIQANYQALRRILEGSVAQRKSHPVQQKSPRDTGLATLNRQKTGRNSPCPCGSGLKFKRCCGRR